MNIMVEEFYNMINSGDSNFNIDLINNKNEIRLLDSQINRLVELIVELSKNGYEKTAKELFFDIIRNPNNSNGKIYEALLYAWLNENKINYEPQVYIDEQNCLKKNGYKADGKINDIIFDVKQFGIGVPHIETFQKKLQEKMPNYIITIGGTKNLSSKIIEKYLLSNVDNIIKELQSKKNLIHTDYIYKLNDYDIEIRAHYKEKGIVSSISEFNPYEWAENNEYYFMRHGSQFCIKNPYIIFCPFDKKDNWIFTTEEPKQNHLNFRCLCRRIFMNLKNIDERKLLEFDGKAKNNISVATASRKISAIVFLDVSDKWDYNNCRMWVYTNPNADNKIPTYEINRLFRLAGAIIEDFRFDNY